MSSGVNCFVCNVPFSEDVDNLPKLLECGHSICYLCVRKIFETGKKCPFCNKPMTFDSPTKFVTNFTVVQFINELNAERANRIYYQENVVKHKESLLKLIEENQKKLRDISMVLGMLPDDARCECKMKQNASELMKLVTKFEKPSNDMMNWVTEFHEACWSAGAHIANPVLGLSPQMRQPRMPLCHPRRPPAPTADDLLLLMRNFRSQKEFLEKIWSRLNKGKDVYVMGTVNLETKYGKIQQRKDYFQQRNMRVLEIHCLSLSQVDRSQATVVMFADVKSCATPENFFLFLEGADGQWWEHYSALKGHFLYMFTALFAGEAGATYKGAPHTAEEGVEYRAPKYMLNGVPTAGPVDGVSSPARERDPETDEEVFGGRFTLCGNSEGAIEVVFGGGRPSSKFFHAIGRLSAGGGVIPPAGAFSDCGIAIEI